EAAGVVSVTGIPQGGAPSLGAVKDDAGTGSAILRRPTVLAKLADNDCAVTLPQGLGRALPWATPQLNVDIGSLPIYPRLRLLVETTRSMSNGELSDGSPSGSGLNLRVGGEIAVHSRSESWISH